MTEALVCITEAGETYCVWVPDVGNAPDGTYIGHIRNRSTTGILQPEFMTSEWITTVVLRFMVQEQEVAHA